LIHFVEFLLVGRLLTWAIQTQGLPRRLWSWSSFLTELAECDFCLGFWIYLFLSVALAYNGLEEVWPEPFWIVCVIQAILASFVMHVFVLGWRSKFSTLIIG
jgi:hypothetical protein